MSRPPGHTNWGSSGGEANSSCPPDRRQWGRLEGGLSSPPLSCQAILSPGDWSKARAKAFPRSCHFKEMASRSLQRQFWVIEDLHSQGQMKNCKLSKVTAPW